mgnify:CR=1 FL=1
MGSYGPPNKEKYMYYNDTPTRKIIRFRYDDSSGDILYDGVAVNIPEGTGSRME